jgi:ubiquinone biosynthesis protein
MRILNPTRAIGKTLRNAGRLRTIVGVFAKHGFANILEKIKLGRFILERVSTSDPLDRFTMSSTVAERLRMSFEELGPTFVKLGQLLASRPDLVPPDFVNEFSRLHDNVQPLSFSEIQQVLKEEYGENLNQYFSHFDEKPLGSASIAQVHRAILKNGEEVVIKVQRPHILGKINDDLSVLYFIAGLIEEYLPEVRHFNPVGIVDEYFKTIELETNFIVEANNLRRFTINFKDHPDIRIPKVNFDLTTERVLVMEALPGIALSNSASLKQEGLNNEQLIKKGIRAYLKMVFVDGLFHGDLHAGNFFILPNNQIGMIDFGVVGRLNLKTKNSIASMLLALSKEDYERIAFDYIDLAPFSERVDIDRFAKDLRDLIAPFYGLTLKNVNLGKLLMSSSAVAGRHGLVVPSELMLFFKSLVHIESLGQKIHPDFDFLKYALEYADEIIKVQYDTSKITQDLTQLARESKHLINGLPRQINFLLRKLSSPDYTMKFRLLELRDLQKAIESSFNLMFLAIIIASLLLSSAFVLVHPSEQLIAGMPAFSFIGFVASAFLGVLAFFNYIRK